MKTDGRSLILGVANLALLSAGIANLVIGTIHAAHGSTAAATSSLTAGLILLLGATIDRFELLKGWGIEARTKLQAEVKQAERAAEQLKKLTEFAARGTLGLVSRVGRWDGATPPREAYELVQETRALLKEAGADEKAMREAVSIWARSAATDLVFSVVGPCYDMAQQYGSVPAPPQTIEELRAYSARLVNDWDKTPLAEMPDRLQALADSFPGSMPPDVSQRFRADVSRWMPELRSLATKLEFQQPEAALARIEWQHNSRQGPAPT